MDTLTTQETSAYLKGRGINLSSSEVANLAKSGIFPGAQKDSQGRWRIPEEDINHQVTALKTRQTKRQWLTVGSITFIITILSLISIFKDALDGFFTYIVPPSSPSVAGIQNATVPPSSESFPLLVFSDSFDGATINTGFWNIKHEGLIQQNGNLDVNFENNGDSFVSQSIEAKLRDSQFSIAEFKAVITEGTINGLLGFDTNCSSEDTNLYFEIRPDNNLTGHYIDGKSDIWLDWDKIPDNDQVYIVRLVQDGDVVRVYVNDTELSEPFPCPSMGKWLVLGAGASPDSVIKGYFEYIKLYSE